MSAAALGYFLLSDRWPSWLLALGVLLAAAGWLGSYRLARRIAGQAGAGGSTPMARLRQATLVAGRILLGLVGIWLAFQVLGRVVVLTTNWPLWPVALIAAAAAETLVWLYALERRTVSARMGAVLTALRLGLLGLLILMLLQPVLVSVWSEKHKSTLAVLVDTSASMQISDPQLPRHQKLRLAERFSVPAARRPYHLEDNAEDLRELRAALGHELAWLDRLAQGKKDTTRTQLTQRRKDLHEAFAAAADRLAKQAEAVRSLLEERTGLPKNLEADLRNAKASLSTQVRPRLLEAADWTHEQQAGKLPDNLDRLRGGLRRAVEQLAKAAPALERVAELLDQALYDQLSPADRAMVDAVAGPTRVKLAKATLLHRTRRADQDEPQESLLARLSDRYNVKVYTFAAAPAEADARAWTDPIPAAMAEAEKSAAATSQPGRAAPPPNRPKQPAGAADGEDPSQRTELAEAIHKVLTESGADSLAGVLLLTDGQDNGQASPEPLARQLGGQGAALCAILMGAEPPPADAAIISIEAPDTVYLADRMFINAELKLDGLAGKEARVTLYDGQRPVDFKTIRVAGDVFRTRIQLADEPKKAGLHPYRVEIEPAEGEVFRDNNSYPLTLSVTDDKTKVLLVDSRPRWEFRYLKNLFSGRDKTVQLQYVLTQPDRFHGEPARPKVHASAKRRAGQEEATLLPENEAEWLKFDVIFLGDVAAKDLSVEHMRSLRRFVTDRGGTMVIVSGPRFMPAAFAATPLAELIPVKLPAGAAGKPAQAPPNSVPAGGFRIALTPEGTEHVILRQDVDPAKSARIWQSVPPVFWRSPFAEATPSATVLAYAVDPNAPKWLSAKPAADGPPPESLLKQREDYQRKHALLAAAPHGLGKVLLLSFDRTWRLRYRVGDTHHHKFWGQVLRWATAGKLPVGTALVKLGTDKTRYAPGARPIARAKMVRDDFSPVVTEQIAIKILSGEKLIGRVPMKYVKDSPGLYTATLEELPAGTYRLELDAPEAEALLKKDNVKALTTEISVDPSSPAEQIELAANRHLLGRLASLSHNGTVVPAYQAERVLDCLPTGKMRQTPPRQFPLWDSWLLLALFCGLVTAEWLLRKKVGLA